MRVMTISLVFPNRLLLSVVKTAVQWFLASQVIYRDCLFFHILTFGQSVMGPYSEFFMLSIYWNWGTGHWNWGSGDLRSFLNWSVLAYIVLYTWSEGPWHFDGCTHSLHMIPCVWHVAACTFLAGIYCTLHLIRRTLALRWLHTLFTYDSLCMTCSCMVVDKLRPAETLMHICNVCTHLEDTMQQ